MLIELVPVGKGVEDWYMKGTALMQDFPFCSPVRNPAKKTSQSDPKKPQIPVFALPVIPIQKRHCACSHWLKPRSAIG